MLYPRASETRTVVDLSGIWDFRVDTDNEGRDAGWQARSLKKTRPMAVPASYNDLTQDMEVRDHIGDVWYERTFFVPAEWEGRRVMLRVGAASHRTVMWVGGTEVCRNKGGFLPFEADVSDVVDYGQENRLTLVVNNILDGETLPPGEIKDIGKGLKKQDYEFDFYNYSGIHRPVRLHVMPETRIEDVTVVTDVKKTDGIVDYEVEVAGGEAEVSVKLLTEGGQTKVTGEGPSGKLTVEKAHLWQPGNAYLYTLEVTLTGPDGDVLDVYRLPVGIRTVEIKRNKFLINGEPFYFKGCGKHEDMDIKGKGLDHAMVVKDFNLLKWLGANSFRTSHYPYAEEILQMADREGIVVIDEAPAVGMYVFKGKQDKYNREALKPLLAHHTDVMRQLVARDKNHPSVVMWSVANEAATQEKAFGPYMKTVFETTRETDPQDRPCTIVVHTWYDNDVAVGYADVICLNRYWGWYGNSGQLEMVDIKGRFELENWWKHQKKPMILSEFGADTIEGLHEDPPKVFSEEYQVEMIRRICDLLDDLPFVIGEHVWNFADFMTKQGITRVRGNRKGILTRQRQPKMAAHFLRERWTRGVEKEKK